VRDDCDIVVIGVFIGKAGFQTLGGGIQAPDAFE
jgi:hypothetical protein